MPGSRGAPELRLAPASSAKNTRERERMSRRLSEAVRVRWCAQRLLYRPEMGERGGRHGLGLGFPRAFPWPQWFWKSMGMSGGAVVT
jgi:hypothetical protein